MESENTQTIVDKVVLTANALNAVAILLLVVAQAWRLYKRGRLPPDTFVGQEPRSEVNTDSYFRI